MARTGLDPAARIAPSERESASFRGLAIKPPAKADLNAAPEASAPILPDSIGFQIRMVQMRMFREFYRAFEGLDMTPGMHSVLWIIRDNPGIRQRTLAELLMVREPNMTRMIQGLHAAGLIARGVDKSDRRAFHLRLTDQGRARMEAVADRLEALENRFLGGMDEAERKALRDYLDRILERVG
jgi:DNA-binding MarR family transcriptional regulator